MRSSETDSLQVGRGARGGPREPEVRLALRGVSRRVTPSDGLLKCRQDWGEIGADFQKATRLARFKDGEALSGLAWKSRDVVYVENFGSRDGVCPGGACPEARG